MARASDWVDNDIGVAVDALNNNASSFPGAQFVGWHGGHGGLPKISMRDPANGPTAYGVISLGQPVLIPSANNSKDEPCRRSVYLVQVMTSTGDRALRKLIFRAGLDALVDNLPASHKVLGQQWQPPLTMAGPAETEFYAATASVPFYAS